MVFVPAMGGGDYGRILFAPTMGGITGGMVFAPTTEYMLPNRMSGDTVLKILPPILQNVLKTPLEGAFLAQGRINTPPHQQHAA